MKAMKKIIMPIALVGLALVLSGCGKTETLTCTMSQDESGMAMNSKIEAVFEGNEVTKLNLNIDAKVDESLSSYVPTMKSVIESQYEKYKKEGATVKVTSKDNTIKADLSFDLKKMSDEDKEELDLIDTKGTKEASKKDLEKEGYTCK